MFTYITKKINFITEGNTMTIQELIEKKITYCESILKTTEHQLKDSRELTALEEMQVVKKRHAALKARKKLLSELAFIDFVK